MSPPPQFTVVVPWHGNRAHLARAVASLRAQTFTGFETIIVANGPGVAAMVAVTHDPAYAGCRFLSVSEADASRARNAGIEAARGRWIAFLDVDDAFLPGKLARIAEEIGAGDDEILISRGYRVRHARLRALYPEQLLGEHEDLGEYFFVRGANCTATSIVSRRDTARAVRFADGLSKFTDTDFLIRASAAGARIRMIAEPLFEWSDDTSEGRMSRRAGYDDQVRWARSLGPALSERAYYAFVARRIAQYRFPDDFVANALALYRGWRFGGIAPREIAQFAVRGLLPKRLVRLLIDIKASRDAGRVAEQIARDEPRRITIGAHDT